MLRGETVVGFALAEAVGMKLKSVNDNIKRQDHVPLSHLKSLFRESYHAFLKIWGVLRTA
jgi:hypothetical protein